MAFDAKAVQRILSDAYAAVEGASLPDDLRSTAFAKAIDMFAVGVANGDVALEPQGKSTRREAPPEATKRREATQSDQRSTPDADTFFSEIATESGVAERDVRDVLRLTDNKVQVTTPTKDLGRTAAEQARNVIALVASARRVGLGEDPVDAEAVRREVERKRCYQQNNFASKHLGAMKGFNAGDRDEIVLTSKWVDEFKAAINQAHGRNADEPKK